MLALSFAAVPGFQRYSTVADHVLIAVRLTIVVGLSILVVHERWFREPGADAGQNLLQRCRRWFYDE